MSYVNKIIDKDNVEHDIQDKRIPEPNAAEDAGKALVVTDEGALAFEEVQGGERINVDFSSNADATFQDLIDALDLQNDQVKSIHLSYNRYGSVGSMDCEVGLLKDESVYPQVYKLFMLQNAITKLANASIKIGDYTQKIGQKIIESRNSVVYQDDSLLAPELPYVYMTNPTLNDLYNKGANNSDRVIGVLTKTNGNYDDAYLYFLQVKSTCSYLTLIKLQNQMNYSTSNDVVIKEFRIAGAPWRGTEWNTSIWEMTSTDYIRVPALPSDASTKAYALKSAAGALTWTEDASFGLYEHSIRFVYNTSWYRLNVILSRSEPFDSISSIAKYLSSLGFTDIVDDSNVTKAMFTNFSLITLDGMYKAPFNVNMTNNKSSLSFSYDYRLAGINDYQTLAIAYSLKTITFNAPTGSADTPMSGSVNTTDALVLTDSDTSSFSDTVIAL